MILASIVGRHVRIIQAHISLEEQRLKVRYSQFYDFEHCSQPRMDLFLRWILSSPLLEPKLQPEAKRTPSSPFGDTAIHLPIHWKRDCELRNEQLSKDSQSSDSTEAITVNG